MKIFTGRIHSSLVGAVLSLCWHISSNHSWTGHHYGQDIWEESPSQLSDCVSGKLWPHLNGLYLIGLVVNLKTCHCQNKQENLNYKFSWDGSFS